VYFPKKFRIRVALASGNLQRQADKDKNLGQLESWRY
jgi:hypothetical protein